MGKEEEGPLRGHETKKGGGGEEEEENSVVRPFMRSLRLERENGAVVSQCAFEQSRVICI